MFQCAHAYAERNHVSVAECLRTLILSQQKIIPTFFGGRSMMLMHCSMCLCVRNGMQRVCMFMRTEHIRAHGDTRMRAHKRDALHNFGLISIFNINYI